MIYEKTYVITLLYRIFIFILYVLYYAFYAIGFAYMERRRFQRHFLSSSIQLILKGQFPMHGYLFAVIFLTFLMGELIAIPFGYVFGKSMVSL